MSTRSYRLTLLVCALAWFMVGMHTPLLQGGLTVGRVREAEQNLVSSGAALTGQQLQVRFDVEQAAKSIQPVTKDAGTRVGDEQVGTK